MSVLELVGTPCGKLHETTLIQVNQWLFDFRRMAGVLAADNKMFFSEERNQKT